MNKKRMSTILSTILFLFFFSHQASATNQNSYDTLEAPEFMSQEQIDQLLLSQEDTEGNQTLRSPNALFLTFANSSRDSTYCRTKLNARNIGLDPWDRLDGKVLTYIQLDKDSTIYQIHARYDVFETNIPPFWANTIANLTYAHLGRNMFFVADINGYESGQTFNRVGYEYCEK